MLIFFSSMCSFVPTFTTFYQVLCFLSQLHLTFFLSFLFFFFFFSILFFFFLFPLYSLCFPHIPFTRPPARVLIFLLFSFNSTFSLFFPLSLAISRLALLFSLYFFLVSIFYFPLFFRPHPSVLFSFSLSYRTFLA